MVRVNQVVINGFWLSDHADIASDGGSIAGKLAYSVHGIVSSDVEKPSDIHFFKFSE